MELELIRTPSKRQIFIVNRRSHPTGSPCYGSCLRMGHGVQIDFTLAAEFSQQISRILTVRTVLGPASGLVKGLRRMSIGPFGTTKGPWLFQIRMECLECGKGIGGNPLRAAKYCRMAAKRNCVMVQNSFGIWFARGIGVRRNHPLAAEYSQMSANNSGFCLEHGRGVAHNFGSRPSGHFSQ
jgi:hypothetical protein